MRAVRHTPEGIRPVEVPVAIEPMIPRGVCEFCGMGDYRWCTRSHEMIAAVAFDGGMADEILLPERCLVRLPHGLDVANACLCEPLAVNIHSLMLGGWRAVNG